MSPVSPVRALSSFAVAVAVLGVSGCSTDTPKATTPPREAYNGAIDPCPLVDKALIERIVGESGTVNSPSPLASRTESPFVISTIQECTWTRVGDEVDRGKRLWIRTRALPSLADVGGDSGEARAEATYQSAVRSINCVPVVIAESSACWSAPTADGKRDYYAGFLRKHNAFVDIGIKKFPVSSADKAEIPAEMVEVIKGAAARL